MSLTLRFGTVLRDCRWTWPYLFANRFDTTRLPVELCFASAAHFRIEASGKTSLTKHRGSKCTKGYHECTIYTMRFFQTCQSPSRLSAVCVLLPSERINREWRSPILRDSWRIEGLPNRCGSCIMFTPFPFSRSVVRQIAVG